MADRWNIDVARFDAVGNLFLDGKIMDQESENCILVNSSSTPIENAENLREAYALAKNKTPNGQAISATNRVVVLLPIGQYDIGTEPVVMDVQFIDIVAVTPTSGKPTKSLVEYPTGEGNPDWRGEETNYYYPPETVIYTTNANYVLEQAVDDVRLIGFGLAALHEGSASNENASALYISVSDNPESYYDTMYFFGATTLVAGGVRFPTYNEQHFRGTWVNCISNSMAWRIRNDTSDWEPTMFDCKSGVFSYVGDSLGVGLGMDCRVIRCEGGDGVFAGCTAFTGPIPAEALFIDCIGGDKCFGQSAEVAGTFIRCQTGNYSFGGSFSEVDTWPNAPGRFIGYAEDCTAGKASFGGTENDIDGYLGGELVRCITKGNIQPIEVQGATIKDSIIETSEINIDALVLLDGNTKIICSEISVNDAGTGIPVNADAAQDVIAVNCTFNNGSNDADGLGANVTNLALTASNGIY
jgi:hypothetical protein